MKKNIIIVCLVLGSIELFSQNDMTLNQKIKIFFDDSAARYVLNNPAKALSEERDSIWHTFDGYKITLIWHKKSSFPITWNIWKKGLNRFLNKDTSLIRKSLELSGQLIHKTDRENQNIVKLISAYLNKNTSFSAYVYLVAFTVPYAFCVEQNKIGIDITGDEWNYDTNCILNTTIHEIYHVGFRLNSPDNKFRDADPVSKETFLRFSYAYLQSEGMATYVGYKALGLFPSKYKHEDYRLLENEKSVRNAISQINRLNKMTQTMPIDKLNVKAWKIGVEKRAYYVAGAYMAKRIEEKYGTDFLARLVQEGSLKFLEEYNAIVNQEYKISLIEL